MKTESPKNIKLIITIILSLIINYNYAQTWVAGQNVTLNVSSYALIATNFAPVNLTLSAPTAGSPVSTATNSDLYVKISSIVPGGTDSELTARIVSGAVPTGTTLTLKSAACTTANSGGARGTPVANPITLSNIDQFLVFYIGTCYTGTGYNDGYKMTFTWSVLNPLVNYQLLASNTYNITVVFTLTAHDGN
jgi:hypothetical protein